MICPVLTADVLMPDFPMGEGAEFRIRPAVVLRYFLGVQTHFLEAEFLALYPRVAAGFFMDLLFLLGLY